MNQVSRLIMILLIFLFLCSRSSWGQTPSLSVYFCGEEIKLAVKNEKGRLYGLEEEMIKLMSISPTNYKGPRLYSNGLEWLPLRLFWEELGFEVRWIPEMNAIIVSEKGKELHLPEVALTLMKKAIADTGWLSLKTQKELQTHLEKFYTPEVVQEILPDTWNFIQTETDWHSLYQLIEAKILDGSDDWLLLSVTIEEHLPGVDSTLLQGIIKLKKLDLEKWRIAVYSYYAE